MPRRGASSFEQTEVRHVTVMGLDPGLRSTGYAVAKVDVRRRAIVQIERFGLVRTERSTEKTVRKTSDDLRRAEAQASALSKIVLDDEVALIAMEMSTTTPYTYPTFSFGVMLGIAASLGPPIIQVLPHELKKAVTGDARATKRDVIEWAMSVTETHHLAWPTSTRANKLGLRFQGKYVTAAAEHPADALAVIQAALHTGQFRLAAAV